MGARRGRNRGRRFQIPMRGNETLVSDAVYEDEALFQIPMRGNEPLARPGAHRN